MPLPGTDALSPDPVDSRGLPAHAACVEAGIQILENPALAGVEPGRCEPRTLPLRIEGADASPARAVLTERE